MSLTPEQFNKIATKEDVKEVKDCLVNLENKFDQLLTSVDNLAKN